MVPCSPLTRHAPQQTAAVERVAWVALVCDSTACEVALVAYLGAELRHARLVAVREFKT